MWASQRHKLNFRQVFEQKQIISDNKKRKKILAKNFFFSNENKK